MKTILLCYTERPAAPRMVERTAELANAFTAKVIVTSVAPVLHSGAGAIDPADPPSRHTAEVDEALGELMRLGVASCEGVTAVGDPARAIVDLAAERDADLIVVGAHEGGLLTRITGGDVSSSVARRAPADVLIVR